MSFQTLDLLYGVAGQYLVFDAPEGRPSSVVSSSLFAHETGDDSTAEVATDSSPIIDPNPNTTFDADSGDGQDDPRVCNLALTTGIVVGRRYRATNAAGDYEDVEVLSISSGAYVVAREPLLNAYASGALFQSTRITQHVDSTWVADKDNLSDPLSPNPRWRWRLEYVVASTTYVHDLYVDLLRYAGRHDVGPTDVDRRAPGWIDRLPTQYRIDQGRSIIDEAYRSAKFDLYNLETADQSIRNREVVNELVTLKAIALVFQDDRTDKAYETRLAQLIAWGKTAIQSSTDGDSAPGDVRPLWRR